MQRPNFDFDDSQNMNYLHQQIFERSVGRKKFDQPKTEISQKSIFQYQYDQPYQNFNQKNFDRNLETKDILGAKPNTLISPALKNLEKAKQYQQMNQERIIMGYFLLIWQVLLEQQLKEQEAKELEIQYDRIPYQFNQQQQQYQQEEYEDPRNNYYIQQEIPEKFTYENEQKQQYQKTNNLQKPNEQQQQYHLQQQYQQQLGQQYSQDQQNQKYQESQDQNLLSELERLKKKVAELEETKSQQQQLASQQNNFQQQQQQQFKKPQQQIYGFPLNSGKLQLTPNIQIDHQSHLQRYSPTSLSFAGQNDLIAQENQRLAQELQLQKQANNQLLLDEKLKREKEIEYLNQLKKQVQQQQSQQQQQVFMPQNITGKKQVYRFGSGMRTIIQ